MLRKLLYWLAGKLPARFIDHEGIPYLERHYLCTVFGTRVYLHRFVGSDPDGLHDHPFLHSCSIILAGWYWEHTWSGKSVKRWFNRIGPDDFHRIELPDNGKDVWTVFFHTARVRPWGFLRPADNGKFLFTPESAAGDPAFSTWHLTAPTANQLRQSIRSIPCGSRIVHNE